MKQFFMMMSIALFALFFTMSCASSRRGKLSDAMGAASDKHKGERRVAARSNDDVEEEEEYYYEEPETYEAYTSDDTSTVEYEVPGFLDIRFFIIPETGVLSGNDFYGYQGVSVGFGAAGDERSVLQLTGGIQYAPVQKTSTLNQSLDGGVLLLNAMLDLKFYNTPRHTFVGQYFLIGGGLQAMFWDYKHRIMVDRYDDNGFYEYTETVSSDRLAGIDLHLGLGLNLIQTRDIHLGLQVTPGVLIWLPTTGQGFDNDVFSTFTYLRFSFPITFINRKK